MARTRARRHILLTAALVLCSVACAILPACGAGAGALRTSAISAAPAPEPYPLQPRHRHSELPPTISPDIMPLLPSPGVDDGAVSPSPSDLAAATIPSSPSPPNPDALEPDSAFAPFSSAAAAVAAQSAAAPPSRAPHVAWALPLSLLAMWLV